MFCVDVEALHPSQQFFSHVKMIPVFLDWISTKQRIKCLAHNTVPPVSLELAMLRSKVSMWAYKSIVGLVGWLWYSVLPAITALVEATAGIILFTTPGKDKHIHHTRWQWKTLLTINECKSKIPRNSVFDCLLLPVGWQMTMENSVSKDFWSI